MVKITPSTLNIAGLRDFMILMTLIDMKLISNQLYEQTVSVQTDRKSSTR